MAARIGNGPGYHRERLAGRVLTDTSECGRGSVGHTHAGQERTARPVCSRASSHTGQRTADSRGRAADTGKARPVCGRNGPTGSGPARPGARRRQPGGPGAQRDGEWTGTYRQHGALHGSGPRPRMPHGRVMISSRLTFTWRDQLVFEGRRPSRFAVLGTISFRPRQVTVQRQATAAAAAQKARAQLQKHRQSGPKSAPPRARKQSSWTPAASSADSGRSALLQRRLQLPASGGGHR